MTAIILWTVAALAVAGIIAAALWPDPEQGPAPTDAAGPDEEETGEEGASEQFGDALHAMNADLRDRDTMALGDWEMDRAIDHYVAAVAPVYLHCAERIGVALEEFMRGETLDPAKPASSIDAALSRLRCGIHEPIDAYRAQTAETGEFDRGELDKLLAGVAG